MKSLRTSVKIIKWETPKDDFSQEAIKHLDLGSANYGSDPDPCIDPQGKKKHRALFHLADHIIESHPEQNKFLFYLLDISVPGLDLATTNLASHLTNNYKNQGLTIRIEKIIEDYFKMSSFSKVDSSSWLHPDYTIALPVFGSKQDSLTSKKLVKLLHKVTTVSREGLLIKKSNLNARVSNQLRKQMSQPKRPTITKNFNWAVEDVHYIPGYISPSGSEQNSGKLSYRVTQASLSSSNDSSLINKYIPLQIKRKLEEDILVIETNPSKKSCKSTIAKRL